MNILSYSSVDNIVHNSVHLSSVMIFLVIVLVLASHVIAECPSGEYDPGPDCSFEVICPRPSAHTYRIHYCDCWCNPGTFRDTKTNACVESCP